MPKITMRLGLVVAALAVATAALSITLRNGDATAAAPTAFTTDGAIAAVPSQVAESYSVFRKQPAEPMPAELAAQVASPALFHRNARLARRFDSPNGVGWIVPGDGVICLVVPDPVDGYGVGCVEDEVMKTRGNVLTMRDRRSGSGFAAVLAPDDATVTVDAAAPAARGATAASGSDGVVIVPLSAGDSVEVQS